MEAQTAPPNDAEHPSRLSGRDARLPPWMRRGSPPKGRPAYDSVVIRGTGIGALVCAARLARTSAFAERVTVIGPPIQQTRQLVGGLTLRARAIDYFAAALGTSPLELLREIFGERVRQASTFVQSTASCTRVGDRVEVLRHGVWLRSAHNEGPALAYGGRNLQIAAGLQRIAARLPIEWSDATPDSVDDCRSLARGERPLVIDCGHKPLADLPQPLPNPGRAQSFGETFPVA